MRFLYALIVPGFSTITAPEAVAHTSTRSPGLMPTASRTLLGNVTCPLTVTVVATGKLQYYRRRTVLPELPLVNEVKFVPLSERGRRAAASSPSRREYHCCAATGTRQNHPAR